MPIFFLSRVWGEKMWKKWDKTIPKGLHWQCVGHPAWFGPGAGRWFLFKSWQQPFGNLEQSSISIVEAVPFWVKSKVPRGHKVTHNLIAVHLRTSISTKKIRFDVMVICIGQKKKVWKNLSFLLSGTNYSWS